MAYADENVHGTPLSPPLYRANDGANITRSSPFRPLPAGQQASDRGGGYQSKRDDGNCTTFFLDACGKVDWPLIFRDKLLIAVGGPGSLARGQTGLCGKVSEVKRLTRRVSRRREKELQATAMAFMTAAPAMFKVAAVLNAVRQNPSCNPNLIDGIEMQISIPGHTVGTHAVFHSQHPVRESGLIYIYGKKYGFDHVYPAVNTIPPSEDHVVGKRGAQDAWNYMNWSLAIAGAFPPSLLSTLNA